MWGPIYDSMVALDGWGKGQLALMPCYGTATFVLAVMPAAWLAERIGLRRIVLLMTALVLASSIARSFPLGSPLLSPPLHPSHPLARCRE